MNKDKLISILTLELYDCKEKLYKIKERLDKSYNSGSDVPVLTKYDINMCLHDIECLAEYDYSGDDSD